MKLMISSGQDIFHASECRHTLTVCLVVQHVFFFLLGGGGVFFNLHSYCLRKTRQELFSAEKKKQQTLFNFQKHLSPDTCYRNQRFAPGVMSYRICLLYLQSSMDWDKTLTTDSYPHADVKTNYKLEIYRS